MRIALLFLLLAVVSCVPKSTAPASGQNARSGPQQASPQPSATAAQAVKPAAAGVTREMMLNLSFHEPEFVEGRVVLRNGVWREVDTNKECGEGFCRHLMWEVLATAVGDLDGDKVNNGAFLVANEGLTIHWRQFFLFAVTVKNGRCVLTRPVVVGDKDFQFKSLSIKDGKVRLVQGLSKKRTATSVYALRKGALVAVKGG